MNASCSNCGYDNPLGANFCSSCGEQLRATADSETEQIDIDALSPAEAPAQEAVLVVRKGPKRGSRIALDADRITIGRKENSDIFLDDITVSRDHAVITRRGSRFTVNDSGSMNGTYVNKKLVDEAELVDGDELQIGKFKLVYLQLGADR